MGHCITHYNLPFLILILRKYMKLKYPLLIFFIISVIVLGRWYSQVLPPVPDVTFTSITGKKIVLKNLQGKIVIINFWATDCKSCIEEIPHLIKLYDNYHSKGLEIISVSMYYDLPNHVVTMGKNKKIPYDLALDLRGQHAKAFSNVQLTPTTFLINSQGQISAKKIGLFDMIVMEKQIQQLISKMPVL